MGPKYKYESKSLPLLLLLPLLILQGWVGRGKRQLCSILPSVVEHRTTAQVSQPESRKEHFDPTLCVVCPQGKYPCSAPS